MDEERRIRSYFKEQVRLVIEQSIREPEGFLSYFIDHDPKDEEILGLLAVTTMMEGDNDMGASFPTTVEALAALSPSRQAEICHQFRKELKHCLRQISAA
jgi:hypothetical protein